MNKLSTALIISLGFIISSFILGSFWKSARTGDRFVTVKGLSERNVEADRAWWAITTNFGTNSIETIRVELKNQEKTIIDFLTQQGFNKDEIKVDNVNIYQNTYNNSGLRYNANLRITVSSENVDLIDKASASVTDLIEKGVLLSGDKWSNGPKYFFTKFTELKTEMIAEATKEAEKAASEFASNSGSKVGKIRRANQGIFLILPSDRSNESAEFFKEKIIRVVSTLEFYLE